MAERASFLKDIRGALGVTSVQERSPKQFPDVFSQPDVTRRLAVISDRSAEEQHALLERFQESGAEIRLQVHIAADQAAAAEIIADIAQRAEPEFSADKQVIQHENQELAALKLSERLAVDGVAVHTVSPQDPEAISKTIASYIGITTADWGIADSATVVQITEPGKARSTSLVPSIHIALLPIERIVADLSELQALLQDNPPSSSYVFISGPSKTGDIESYLVYGAHGPKEMHVIVLTGRHND
jgi:L-lactate dehydrogenase complex protein LldG